MKISFRTIEAVGKIITGDGKISPYRSGPQLVSFFNVHGANERYGNGFPSRWLFTQDLLEKFNDTNDIKTIIEDTVDPRDYLETDFDVLAVVDNLNKYLAYDQLKLVENGMGFSVYTQSGTQISTPIFSDSFKSEEVSHAYIVEQSDKCKEKLASCDFDGAITNARSMVEAVFIEILKRSDNQLAKYDGDLNKLYKEVKKQLHLDASQAGLSDTLKQIISGLSSIVTGIAGISNKMGDRHARTYKPEKHHAVLAVNTAYSLCEFLLSSQEYQDKKKALSGGKSG